MARGGIVGPARKRGASSGDFASVAPREPVVLTIYLRHRQRVRRRPGSAADLAELSRRVSHRELEAERKQVLKRSIAEVRRFAKLHRMKVLEIDYLRRRVRLGSTASAVGQAFATHLKWSDESADSGRHYPVRKPSLPKRLGRIVHAVLGMDTRPLSLGRLRSHAEAGGSDGLLPTEMARLYGLDGIGRGAGQCVALIEPGGGYRDTDLAAACNAMRVPVPRIIPVEVGHGRNAPGADQKADLEVALDMQVVAGIAPEAQIAVYFTEAGAPGLVAGVCEAVHGPRVRPSVIVITWGQAEESWPPEARRALDAVLQDAVRLGITVVASSGDDFATDRMQDGQVHVDYPAASPYVLGCGGTLITLDATRTRIVKEVVWNELRQGTGGGVSSIYPVPAFQSGTTLPVSLNDGKSRGRGVPDVAAAAAQENGYRIVVEGAEVVNSGTSAVAPLWGAFIALINARRNKTLGFVNTELYAAPTLFNPITSGTNAGGFFKIGYEAQADGRWNACTGLGTPKGPEIIAALSAVA
jgi:kumamolisin